MKISDEQKQKIIETFLANLETGATFDNSCKSAGTNRTTIWRWRKENPELDEQVNQILDSRTQVMEDALFKTGVGGNVVAQIFWLKNRGQGRWKDVQNVDVKGELNVTDARAKLISKLDSLASKRETESTDK